jgi:Peptidase family M28
MSGPRHRSAQTAAGALLAALILALAGCGDGGSTVPAADRHDGFDAGRAFSGLRAQVEFGPRPSGSAAARALSRQLAAELREAGVRDVGIQRPLRNVVGVIPGRGPGWVVLGAHYDTKDGIPGFVGANDGASGVAVVLELARSLPNPMPGPSLAIALFDGEEARGDRPFGEDGTRGSRQYVADAERGRGGSPPIDEIEAMVLLDMVGDCDLAIPREANSDEGLYELFAAADPELFDGTTGAVDDDHVPFLEAGIPAVDLIDFDYGPGPTPGGWWHTTADDLDDVCPASLDVVGGAALRALPRIGTG